MAVLVTAFLLPLVVGTAWKCWCLPPVPAIRIWAWLFRGMSANNARADGAGGDVENRAAWQGTNVPRLRLKQDGRRARNPARGFAAEAAKVAIALKGKGARHIYAAQK